VLTRQRPPDELAVPDWRQTAIPDALRAEVTRELRHAGARFALLHGSRSAGSHRPDSDIDVAAWCDPPARVRWVATTRKIYADEQPRLRRSHREFAESVRRGR
jgi:predicted nucleotidyltransferase